MGSDAPSPPVLPPDKLKIKTRTGFIAENVMSADDFALCDIEDSHTYLTPWLKAGTVSMVYASRGVGKSWFCLSLLFAITRGMQFGNWDTSEPTDCLYIDGEMSVYDLRDRLSRMSAGLPPARTKLSVLSCDLMRAKNDVKINLINNEWREAMGDYLREHRFGAICFDNIASLAYGRDESSKDEWDEVNQWLLSLRAMGMAVILVHHAGKNNDQRGTSAHEDNLDYVIRLSKPKGHKISDGAKFRVAFTKSRGLCGPSINPFTVKIQHVDGNLTWATDVSEDDKRAAVINLFGTGTPQKYIHDKAGCSPALVTKYKKEAIASGMLNDDGTFTEAGKKRYAVLSFMEAAYDEDD